jgi:hypothetical protein
MSETCSQEMYRMDSMNTDPSFEGIVTAARGEVGRLIALAEGIEANLAAALQAGTSSVILEHPPCNDFSSSKELQDTERSKADLQLCRDLVQAIRDIAVGRPEISGKRGKDAWQGTALLQSSLLGEIDRLCGEHLRSTVSGPRPLGTKIARGPKTEALAERDGMHIRLKWIRNGTEYFARIYEPNMMDITPALADVLALSVEEPLRVNAEYGL